MTSASAERYEERHWPAIEELLSRWRFGPFPGGGSGEGSAGLCLARARRALAMPGASPWLTRVDERCCGFAMLLPLAWDSQWLGMAAGRVDYLVASGGYEEQRRAGEALLSAILAEAARRGVRHVSARIDSADLASLHALEGNGFVVMDGLLTFSRSPEATGAGPGPRAIRRATPADAERLAALARRAFLHDRFHADPAIPALRADELHADWARNCALGTAADTVLIAESGGELLGFVACRVEEDAAAHLGMTIGVIPLVATAAGSRRRGVARGLTQAALAWFHDRGAGSVEVGTQIRNLEASRLYEGCGFRLARTALSLRWLGPATP